MIQVFDGYKQITGAETAAALDTAVAQVERNLAAFTYQSQDHSSQKGFYKAAENNDWTNGFWPGQIWLAYEHTGDVLFQYAGNIQVESFLHRIQNKIVVDHHDMGFLYSPSCVASYMLCGNQRAKEAALMAANQLIIRYQPAGEFIQAWGELGAEDNYRYIIDCLLNLPLLYWASEETGGDTYRRIAHKHITTCLRYSLRPDGSTFHTVFMDKNTGGFSHGATAQGYKDDSAWARGQAWAIYGTALSYRYTKNPEYMDAFNRALEYYLTRLPEDLVPYWDMFFTSGSEQPRDSSSAAIAACGLLEMAKYVDKDASDTYMALAKQFVYALVQGYSVQDPAVSNGQLLHGTYCKSSPYNTVEDAGVDECVSWGDYFYMEALTRLHKDWKPYW